MLVRLAGQMFSGYDAADPGVPAIAAIANGIGEVDRRHPDVDPRAAFLREQQRGSPRCIAIVKGRNP